MFSFFVFKKKPYLICAMSWKEQILKRVVEIKLLSHHYLNYWAWSGECLVRMNYVAVPNVFSHGLKDEMCFYFSTKGQIAVVGLIKSCVLVTVWLNVCRLQILTQVIALHLRITATFQMCDFWKMFAASLYWIVKHFH